MSLQPNAREVAMEILTKVEQQQAYSNLLLHQTLQRLKLERVEAALATEIVYGTIQRRNTINYFLSRYLPKGLAKLEPWVRSLLQLSFYQLYYLDRIPMHAVVNEAVNIAKRKSHKGISGMINGVLRNVIRTSERGELVLPKGLSPLARISLAESHPEWMVARWIKQFGEQITEQICKANNRAPHISVRVNTIKNHRDELIRQMIEQEFQVSPSPLSIHGILVQQSGNMAHTDWFTEGKLSIQDESSMLVAAAVDPRPGMNVLDCCAAPGGKTTHMAELMNNQGKVYANDIHPHKQKLIEEQAKRLHLNCIETIANDAKYLSNELKSMTFDRILVDAPCSGLGVIRRKPDLKWVKEEKEIGKLPELQLEILSSAAQLLHPDGVLVYSTCTLECEENQEVVKAFLGQHPQFELDPSINSILPKDYDFHQERQIGPVDGSTGMVRILPHEYESDGFFIAKFKIK